MSIAEGNCYWEYQDVSETVVGLYVMAPVRVGDPLRKCIVVTVDMDETPPLCLLEDEHGQVWTVPARKLWTESAQPGGDAR